LREEDAGFGTLDCLKRLLNRNLTYLYILFKFKPEQPPMPRKQSKPYRKNSHEAPPHKVRYQEKTAQNWQCSVCGQMREASEDYCLTCAQSLYYYCYINNQMFVAKDDSYLDFYYIRPHEESDYSDVDADEGQPQTQINLGWVEDLLG
jgi:hypothetical protein